MSQARSSSTSSSKASELRKFFTGLLAPLVICALYAGFATLVLVRAGEYMPLDKIIEKLERTDGHYGSAILQRGFYYKLHVFRARNPRIVALGSSRVLGFRQEDFAQPFSNLGILSDLDELYEVATTLFKDGKAPQTVILGVDFWWFHPQATDRVVNRSPENPHIEANDLFQPALWLMQGKLAWKDVFEIIDESSPNIGIFGITQGDGFDKAGAYYYTSTLRGARKSEDYKFKTNLAQIKNSHRKYAHGKEISAAQWQKFLKLVDYMQLQGIRIVMFVPPLAERVYKAMDETGGYGYVTELRKKLGMLAAERNMPFFDYHEGGPRGASECEFIDSHHGGTTVYQRILLDMATKDDDLRGRLNLAEIGWNIEHYAGRASLRDDETDFLGIGCDKPAKAPSN